MLRDAPNIQSLWGDLIVEELVRGGVEHFVVCPGSRSTPLVQAIARNPNAHATVWIDERGAAFHALGRGRATGGPHAVVTTSGTAVANLLPAVVEASLDCVPLLLLTADRPPELREVGANQSIRQVGLFSDHVRWAFDLPAPGTDMPARALLTTIDHAVQRCTATHPGPVQINCPFREPLAPSGEPWDAPYLATLEAWMDGEGPLTHVVPSHVDPGLDAGTLAAIRSARQGLVVCGPLDDGDELVAVQLLLDELQWPVWADVRSPLHGNRHVDRLLAAGAYTPDVILQLGCRITSKRIQTALGHGSAQHHILVAPEPTRLDPSHRVTTRYVGSIETWCDLLGLELRKEPLAEAAPDLSAAEARIEAALEDAIEDGGLLSEPYAARWLTRAIHPDHGLFASNSMPIRDLENYGAADAPRPAVAGNRGASGIDGIVSTAAGFAQGLEAPTTLLVGDLALLHDINALAMLKALEQPLTIVVLNNGGGSIFSFLPIAEHDEVLTPLVSTPHAITFDGVCASFDVPHAHVADRKAFAQAYEEAIRSGTSWVIEVDSSLAGNKDEHERIEAVIQRAVDEA